MCGRDQWHRPIVGSVNLCVANLVQQAPYSTSAASWNPLLASMLQSLLGMMGLDLDSAPLWYDHTTGEPRSFSQSLRVTTRGSVVSTPAATLVAQRYWGCSSLEGVALDAAAGSHRHGLCLAARLYGREVLSCVNGSQAPMVSSTFF